jgi:hypothetical protein
MNTRIVTPLSGNSQSKQERREAEIFLVFASVCPLNIDLRSVSNEKPPLPDISCIIDGKTHYFELGEAVDEGLAERGAYSLKSGLSTGGAFSQDKPLIRVVKEKSKKNYPVSKETLDLLVYYDKQLPLPEALLDETKNTLMILVRDMTLFGNWNRVWFYDHFSREILDVYPE